MPLLGETVEASREKRLERQQARFRDRGGIFKPSGHNALLDILLARGINGESPSRANSPRRSRSRSASPSRKHTAIEPSTRAPHSAPKKRASRKSEGRKVVQEDTHNDAYNDAAPHEEECIAGPSNYTTRTKFGTERPTKASTKKSRSQASITQIQTETHEDDTAAEPGPSRRLAKGSRAKKSTTCSQPKRNAKRKAPVLEPAKELIPSAHDLDDDRSLRPQKEASAKNKRKAKTDALGEHSSTAEAKELKGDVEVSEPPKARRRGASEADTTRTSTVAEKATVSRTSSNPSAKQTRQQDKGKRKAKAIVIDRDDDRPDNSRSTKTPLSKKDAPQFQSHANDDNGMLRQAPSNARHKNHLTDHFENIQAANGNKITSSKTNSKDQKLTTPTTVEYEVDEEALPLPDVPAMPSSPDLPLAKTAMSSQKSAAIKARSPKRKEDTDDIEHDIPPPPRKKRRPPEDVTAPAITAASKDQPALIDNTTRKVSRTKAPPILAPKGTILKPKPRPRLSLFPAPTLEEDSDDDPINFLS
ncbi:hypothetical protein ONZ51_g9179 [Trametes cubensis]|uniref:Uncharacterized protein n=1 Tax=Trametes cubensis TaxID=1111947 RepID=A0AAD7XA25_9APHY|nr:hypothetical protein ONZ51_g9179 [Trametes cubensis]